MLLLWTSRAAFLWPCIRPVCLLGPRLPRHTYLQSCVAGNLILAWNICSPVATQEIYDGSNERGAAERKHLSMMRDAKLLPSSRYHAVYWGAATLIDLYG